MKKLFIILFLAFVWDTTGAQGIVFREGSFAEALTQAKSQDKLVFIDVYTSWCGPCKMMSSEIFPQQEAGDFFNTSFINFKADAEKSEDGKYIARTYNVTAYPTFLFVNGDGELIYRFLGAKSLEELIKEGEKAVSAMQTYPELKKFEKQYNAGNHDMDFLLRYAELMGISGLDASSVLIDYLMQVDDSELLIQANLSRIAGIQRYDSRLSQRLITMLEQFAADPEKNEKEFSKANSSVGKYFSGTIRYITYSGTEKHFDELLALKKRFLGLGNTNSVSIAMLGGGAFYLPAEMLQLDYYNNKGNGERFMEIFDCYTIDVREPINQVKETVKSMEENVNTRIKEAIEKGDEKEVKELQRSAKLMKLLAGMDNTYISATLLEYIESYDKYYVKVKEAPYRDKLVEWYMYFSSVSPSVKAALYTADKLVELGHNTDAIIVLETGIETGRDASEVTPELIADAERKLKELRDNK